MSTTVVDVAPWYRTLRARRAALALVIDLVVVVGGSWAWNALDRIHLRRKDAR